MAACRAAGTTLLGAGQQREDDDVGAHAARTREPETLDMRSCVIIGNTAG